MHLYQICALVLAFAPVLSGQAQSPVNAVMATLTVKSGLVREQIMKVMPDEVKATVKLYLDGKIQQWYARADGKGVVLIMNCSTVPEAKNLMDALPLSKAGFADFDYMPLTPLTPLRILLSDPGQVPKN